MLLLFSTTWHRVLRIIKLKLFAVPVRLHSGSGNLNFRRYFTIIAIFKNVVHAVTYVFVQFKGIPHTVNTSVVYNVHSLHWHRQFLKSCALLNWIYFRFRCVCPPVPVNWYFVVISPHFSIFKNVVHSFEPGETPSYSASHQAPNYAQRS